MNLILALSILFSHYRGSIFLDALCPGPERAAVVVENHGDTKLAGYTNWSIYEVCGPGCYGIFTRPFNLVPGGHEIITYQAATLDRVDFYLLQPDIAAPYFTAFKRSNSCE